MHHQRCLSKATGQRVAKKSAEATTAVTPVQRLKDCTVRIGALRNALVDYSVDIDQGGDAMEALEVLFFRWTRSTRKS